MNKVLEFFKTVSPKILLVISLCLHSSSRRFTEWRTIDDDNELAVAAAPVPRRTMKLTIAACSPQPQLALVMSLVVVAQSPHLRPFDLDVHYLSTISGRYQLTCADHLILQQWNYCFIVGQPLERKESHRVDGMAPYRPC